MQWLERMNLALDYIEENLDGEISFEVVAKRALCSTFHFHRIFSFIANIPLAEYIRRRRLTLAAQELQTSQCKVIDIAIKYGYDSPDAFTRAFQKFHGITPSASREPEVILKAYPKISFYITLKGDTEMEYRIVEREGFKVFGKNIDTTLVDGKCFNDINRLWKMCRTDGTYEKIGEMAGYKPRKEINTKHIGSVAYNHKPDGTFMYMVAAELPYDLNVEPFDILEIPKNTWAVFVEKCSYDDELTPLIQSIWKRIPEWLEATGFEYADAPSLEQFKFIESGKVGEVWIPIIKKTIIL